MRESKIKAFFKKLPFALVVTIVVGGCAAFVGFFLAVFYGAITTNSVFATGMLAIATFLLAGAAFWTIWQNHQFHARERKERLLIEIIEWAEDVARLNFLMYNFVEARISKEPWTESGIGAIVSQFQVTEAKGVYIINVTLASFGEDRRLLSSVKAVNKEIREFADISIERLNKKVATDELAKHMDLLRLKIANLFKEAAKTKAKI